MEDSEPEWEDSEDEEQEAAQGGASEEEAEVSKCSYFSGAFSLLNVNR